MLRSSLYRQQDLSGLDTKFNFLANPSHNLKFNIFAEYLITIVVLAPDMDLFKNLYGKSVNAFEP